MVETITPVVHEGRRRSYAITVGLHILGATLTAAALGLLLAGAGAILSAPWRPWSVVAIVALSLLYGAREATGLPVPIPDRHRQVPDWWRSFFSPPVAALLYGVGLGVGFLTFLSFGTFVVVAAGAFVSGDPTLGAALCAPFGFGRAAAVVVAGSGDAARAVDRLDDLAALRLPHKANAMMLVAVAVAAATALV